MLTLFGTGLASGGDPSYPAISNLQAKYLGGRRLQLTIPRPSIASTQIVYADIERNGEPYYTGRINKDTDYTIWYISSHQIFIDSYVCPGETYIYSVTYRTDDGKYSETAIVEIEVPFVEDKPLTATYINGRVVSVYRDMGTVKNFPDAAFHVYRDGVHVGTFSQNTTGAFESGDSWLTNNSGMWFNDRNAHPGQTHEYRVEIVLFEGMTPMIQKTNAVVPMPSDAANLFLVSYLEERKISIKYDSNNTKDFPECTFELYRDGMKLGEFTQRISQNLENGDSWVGNTRNVTYNDNHALVGQEHEYTLVARLYPGGPSLTFTRKLLVPLPDINNVLLSVMEPRRVNLRIDEYAAHSFPNRLIELYRDGEKIMECLPKTTGELSNGDFWNFSSKEFRYTGFNLIPGQTYQFTVRIILYPGGPTVERTQSIALPSPRFDHSNFKSSYSHGSRVDVNAYISGLTGFYPNMYFHLYRDGELLGEFLYRYGTSGTMENGDQWSISGYWFIYYDYNATPGKTHNYSVRITLFEGYTLEFSRSVQIPVPSVPQSVVSVYRESGRRVTVSIRNNWASYRGLRYAIYRDETKLAEFSARNPILDPDTSDYVTKSTSYLYYVDTKHGVPGTTHTYRVEYIFADDVRFDRSASIHISDINLRQDLVKLQPNVGDGVLLSIGRGYRAYADLKYRIYRDDILVGELKDGVSGSSDNGNIWFLNPTTMYFHDATATMGHHEYRVVFQLFPGCEYSLNYTTTSQENRPSVLNYNYLPVIKKLPDNSHLLGLTIKRNGIADGQQFRVSLDGLNAVFEDNGESNMTLEGRDFPETGMLTFYVVAKPVIYYDNEPMEMSVGLVR